MANNLSEKIGVFTKSGKILNITVFKRPKNDIFVDVDTHKKYMFKINILEIWGAMRPFFWLLRRACCLEPPNWGPMGLISEKFCGLQSLRRAHTK